MSPIGYALGTLVVAAALLGGPAVWWADRHTVEIHLAGPSLFGWRPSLDWAPFGESLGSQLAALKAKDATAAARVRTITLTQTRIVQAAGRVEIAAQAQIRTQAAALQSEIPDVLTPAVDRRYPLPVGLVRLYDASVLGLPLDAVADPAGRADDAASSVADSDAASVFVANNAECLADRERLVRLQDTWRALAAAADAPPTDDRKAAP